MTRAPVAAGPVARRASAAALLMAGAISVAGCYGGAPVDYEEPQSSSATSAGDEEPEAAGSEEAGTEESVEAEAP